MGIRSFPMKNEGWEAEVWSESWWWVHILLNHSASTFDLSVVQASSLFFNRTIYR